MKHIFLIFIIFISTISRSQGQIDCRTEIQALKQEIAELKKSNSTFQREASEARRGKDDLRTTIDRLQAKIALLEAQLGGKQPIDSPVPGGTIDGLSEEENKKLKQDIEGLKKQIEALKKVNDTKEVLLSEASEMNGKQIESIKTLTKNNGEKEEQLKKQEQEIARLIKDLEETKSKLTTLEKTLQDTSKSLIAAKSTNQILYDSLYFSIDFKKDFIHLDIKETDAKDAKLGDVLIEIPNSIIVGTNWTTNNIEKKMKRIAALYVKYRDKLKIQLNCNSA
jgi:DNA repair exonuclease SbcCD ATPase subunit